MQNMSYMSIEDWQTKFKDLFSCLDHPWDLEIVKVKKLRSQRKSWDEIRYKGKAKFECSTHTTCKNKWTSANAGAVFRYRLLPDRNNGKRGKAKLFLGRQKCKRCKCKFENAQWAAVCVEEALNKLLTEIKQTIYKVETRSTTGNSYIPANMKAPHQTQHCEFCQWGYCQYNRQNSKNRKPTRKTPTIERVMAI